jgi:hypothetical protein
VTRRLTALTPDAAECPEQESQTLQRFTEIGATAFYSVPRHRPLAEGDACRGRIAYHGLLREGEGVVKDRPTFQNLAHWQRLAHRSNVGARRWEYAIARVLVVSYTR